MSILEEVKGEYDERRKERRQPVVLKCSIDIAGFLFKAIVYDLSLCGARVKMDLPLTIGTKLQISIQESAQIEARLVWTKNGFMGLQFTLPAKEIKSILGNLGEKL